MSKQITRKELFKENSWSFKTFKSGHLTSEETEHLLPAGVTEKEEDDIQLNQDIEPLYPTGINPE